LRFGGFDRESERETKKEKKKERRKLELIGTVGKLDGRSWRENWGAGKRGSGGVWGEGKWKSGREKESRKRGKQRAGRREFGSDIDVEGSTYKFTGKS
jgi:hypothetical protein